MFLASFRRREILDDETLSEFVDPSGVFVASFGHPNPEHPSSAAKLMHLKGYKPADPDNPSHRKMFPKCLEKNGYLVDMDGNIAMLYPKQYWEEHMREKANARIPAAGTNETYREVMELEGGKIKASDRLRAQMQYAATAVGAEQPDVEVPPEAKVEDSISRVIERQPQAVQEALKRKLETNEG